MRVVYVDSNHRETPAWACSQAASWPPVGKALAEVRGCWKRWLGDVSVNGRHRGKKSFTAKGHVILGVITGNEAIIAEKIMGFVDLLDAKHVERSTLEQFGSLDSDVLRLRLNVPKQVLAFVSSRDIQHVYCEYICIKYC
jgi:hypothetical protein